MDIGRKFVGSEWSPDLWIGWTFEWMNERWTLGSVSRNQERRIGWCWSWPSAEASCPVPTESKQIRTISKPMPLAPHVRMLRIPTTIVRSTLTRALEGGGGGAKNAHPSGFSRKAEKRRRAAPQLFQHLLTIELDTLCKNFSPRSPKVRSPGQVKVKNGFLTLRLRSGHTRYPIGFKPSEFHKVIDTYNLYISDFLYPSPEVRSISWPHHSKSMGKNSNCSYWMIVRLWYTEVCGQNHLNPS